MFSSGICSQYKLCQDIIACILHHYCTNISTVTCLVLVFILNNSVLNLKSGVFNDDDSKTIIMENCAIEFDKNKNESHSRFSTVILSKQ